MTKGMPLPLRESLESLSSYHHEPEGHGGNGDHVCSSLLHIIAGGSRWFVLSRSADAGVDYTHRHNFFVHHVAFAPDETQGIDPISLLNTPNFLQSKWDGRVEELPIRPKISNGTGAWPGQARPGFLTDEWKNAIVDEALAGKIAYLIAPDHTALGLAESLLAAAAEQDRWNVTFITHFQSLPPGARCGIRCVAPNSPKLRNLNRSDTLVVDLTKPLGTAPAPLGHAIAHAAPEPKTFADSRADNQKAPPQLQSTSRPD
jgi:hypothetical protein